MSLPTNRIKKVKLPNTNVYEVVPERLQGTDGEGHYYEASLPAMDQDAVLALRSDIPVVPTVNDATITIHQDGVATDQTFTLNQSGNKTINLADTDTTYTFAEGSTNGKFSVTPKGGSAQSVKVHGLNDAAYKGVDTSISSSSTDSNVPTSKAVYDAISGISGPMVFKGTVGTGGTIEWASLPSAASSVGFTYKVISDHSTAPVCKAGDTIVATSTEWVVIPSGDEPAGTVTSVAMTVPTGLSVSGSPITSSGTLAVSLASGYKIPQTSELHEYELNSSDSTSTGAYKYLEDISYTAASASGSNTVSKSTHTHTVTANGSVDLGSNDTSTNGVAYVAGITNTAASASGTAKAGSETHTHTYDKTTGIDLTANAESATGRITYVQSISGGSASGTGSGTAAPNQHTHTYDTYSLSGSNASGTTKYMKFNAGTTPPSGATANTAPTASAANTDTAVAAVTGYANFSGGSGSLTSNDTAASGIEYIESASFTAASLGTASTSDAAPNGHTHTSAVTASRAESGTGTAARRTLTISGTTSSANSGSAIAAVTGYPSFSGGSATHATKYLHHSHTAASLGSPSTSNVAPNGHKHNYDKVTSISLTAGTAPSMNFNTEVSTDIPYIAAMTNGSLSLTTNATAGTSGKNSGSGVSVISGVSYTAPTATTKYLSAAPSTTSTNSGAPSATTQFVTGVQGGTTTPTTKYFHPSFTGSSATTSDGSNATATAVSGVSGGSVDKTTKYIKLNEKE